MLFLALALGADRNEVEKYEKAYQKNNLKKLASGGSSGGGGGLGMG
ncbi:hypothetical protein NOR53_2068 [gamma proteobacterium NOR5-3]|nr:hypothetical protein NOR53_2068 [gamma proteobacterium NOR5-3]